MASMSTETPLHRIHQLPMSSEAQAFLIRSPYVPNLQPLNLLAKMVPGRAVACGLSIHTLLLASWRATSSLVCPVSRHGSLGESRSCSTANDQSRESLVEAILEVHQSAGVWIHTALCCCWVCNHCMDPHCLMTLVL